MTVSSTVALPEKDFKAVIKDGEIKKVGIEFFDDALAAQPLYRFTKEDWETWLDSIVRAPVLQGTSSLDYPPNLPDWNLLFFAQQSESLLLY